MDQSLLVLALVAAFYPTLLAAVIVMLSLPRADAALGAFLAGAVAVSALAAALVLLGLDASGATDDEHRDTVSPVVDLVAGVIALLLAGALHWRLDERLRHRRAARQTGDRAAPAGESPPVKGASEGARKDTWITRAFASESLALAVVLGIALGHPSIWYLTGLKDIAHAQHSLGVQILLVVAFIVVMFAWVEVALILHLRSPERSRAVIDEIRKWLTGNARLLAAAAAAFGAVFLVVRGLVDLL